MLNREIEIVRLIFHSSKRCVHSSKRCFENLKNDQRGQKLEQDWCQHIPMVTTMCVDKYEKCCMCFILKFDCMCKIGKM